MSKVPIMGYRCQRCGHEWLPRRDSKNPPKVCPRCKSPYWDRPKKKVAKKLISTKDEKTTEDPSRKEGK